jgi:hypothetical protein
MLLLRPPRLLRFCHHGAPPPASVTSHTSVLFLSSSLPLSHSSSTKVSLSIAQTTSYSHSIQHLASTSSHPPPPHHIQQSPWPLPFRPSPTAPLPVSRTHRCSEGHPLTAPDLKIVDRVNSVPVVHDSVVYAEQLIKSTQITTNLYQTVLGLAARALQTAEPVISRTQPLISSADNLAVATFDRVEAAFPYLKTPTQELAGFKQAKAFHDERVVPALEEVIKKTSAINTELGSLQTKAAEVIHKGEKASHELVEQLKALREQSKDLPAQLIEGLGKVTNDVKAIVLAKDGTVQEKTNKLGSYVVEQVKPIIDEIYKHVLGAKKAAVEKVQEAAPAQQQTTPAPSQEKEKVIDTPSE